MSAPLPDAFASLAPFTDKWVLASEKARREARMTSSMEEIKAFYNAMKPVLDDAIQHLNQFELEALPEAEQNLLWLCQSLVEVSVAVELFFNPWPRNAYPWEKFAVTY